MNEVRISTGSELAKTTPQELGSAHERTEGFLEKVTHLIEETDRLQENAEHEIRDLAHGSGRTTETMIALSRAETSMRFIVSLRNRAIRAYQDIMRLQV